MKGPELALVLAAAACAPISGKIELDTVREAPGVSDDGDTGTAPLEEGCHRDAYIHSYPGTLVEHADVNPLTDVKNSVMVSVYNLGTEPCPSAELHLSSPNSDHFLELDALEPGASTKLTQKAIILDQSGNAEFTASVEGMELSSSSLPSRSVGSVLVGQMAELLSDEKGGTLVDCEEDSDNGVIQDSSYCEAMQWAAEEGLFTSDRSGGGEYDTLDYATLATVVVRAFPEYFDVIGTPCPDLDPSQWYYADMQAFQLAFPEIDFCDPNGHTLIHDLYGSTHPNGGVFDQIPY